MPEGAERETNVGYLRGILVTLLTVLEEKVSKSHTDVAKYGATLPARLFTIVLEAGRADASALPLASDARVLQDIGRLTTVLVRTLSVEKQRDLNSSLATAFLAADGPLNPAPPHRKGSLPRRCLSLDPCDLQKRQPAPSRAQRASALAPPCKGLPPDGTRDLRQRLVLPRAQQSH